jgi:hypothetical protein
MKRHRDHHFRNCGAITLEIEEKKTKKKKLAIGSSSDRMMQHAL